MKNMRAAKLNYDELKQTIIISFYFAFADETVAINRGERRSGAVYFIQFIVCVCVQRSLSICKHWYLSLFALIFIRTFWNFSNCNLYHVENCSCSCLHRKFLMWLLNAKFNRCWIMTESMEQLHAHRPEPAAAAAAVETQRTKQQRCKK